MMNTITTSLTLNPDRRRFLGTAALTLAAAQLGAIGSASAQPSETTAVSVPAVTPGTHTSLGPIKQVSAGVLSIGYAEAGSATDPVVILLHGWPYDIHSFIDVVPILMSKGYRVIAAMARRSFFQAKRTETASNPLSPLMSLP